MSTRVSSDATRIIGSGLIALAIIGSAWMLSYALIELLGGIRADLRDLRDSLEQAACGELARREGAAPEAGDALRAGSPTASLPRGSRERVRLPSAPCEGRAWLPTAADRDDPTRRRRPLHAPLPGAP